jgi:hypothetical protein
LILEVTLVESTISTKQTQQFCAPMKDISSTSFLNFVELMTSEAEWIGARLVIERSLVGIFTDYRYHRKMVSIVT